jgi:transcriptional regulator with XRE-family HTH domain
VLRAVHDTNRMIKEMIGKRLRDLRQRKGLTQKALAKIAGVDFTYIGKIERGEQLPSLNVLIKFSECLSLPLDRFFMDEATWRLVSLAPKDVYGSIRRENLYELLRLLEGVPEEDISLLTEILRVLRKHREIKEERREVLPMVAETQGKYKKKKKT